MVIKQSLRDEKIRFVDLNRDELIRTPLRASYTGMKDLWLPRTVLEADFLVSMPKIKAHHWSGVTLSMKNMFGVVPGARYGWPKNILHWKGIQESILDLCATVPIHFVIADGRERRGEGGWGRAGGWMWRRVVGVEEEWR